VTKTDLKDKLTEYLEEREDQDGFDATLVEAILDSLEKDHYPPAECVEAWCTQAEDAVERLKADLARQPWWPGYDPDAEDEDDAG
jgi:hypothetical protein